MLNQDIILEHLNRLGLDNYNMTENMESDQDGDYIKAFFPELDIDTVKQRIFQTKYYAKFLDSFTVESFNIGIQDDIDGYRTFYRLVIKKEDFGVSFSALVKRIEYYDRFGVYRPALGSKMLQELIQNDTEEEERIELAIK